MPSHPISLRDTRKAVSQTIDAVHEQRLALAQAIGVTRHCAAILQRPFLGRLRWLLTGK